MAAETVTVTVSITRLIQDRTDYTVFSAMAAARKLPMF